MQQVIHKEPQLFLEGPLHIAALPSGIQSHRRIRQLSSPRCLSFLGLPFVDLLAQEFDRGISCFKWAIVWSLRRFPELRIDYLALSRCVFVISGWKYRDNVDDPARNLEFQAVTRLDARATADAWGHHELLLIFDNNRHEEIEVDACNGRIALRGGRAHSG